MKLTKQEQIDKLKFASLLLFELETSYPWSYEDQGDIRHDSYRIRIYIGDLINRINKEIHS